MKYYGKEKCKILKQIRAEIAKNNDIDYVIEECPYQGNCKGVCPKCEQEVKDLEKKLAERRKNGLKVAIAGIAASLPLTVMTGCTPEKPDIMGDYAYVAPSVDTQTEESPETTAPDTSTDDDIQSVELQGDIAVIEPIDDTEPLLGEPVEPELIMGKIAYNPDTDKGE